MKKTLIAMAALAAAGVASAQSSVTLYGIADVAVAYGKGSISKRTSMNSSGISSSQFGIRGVEDLGGGLSAGFHFESDIAADSGVGATTNTNNQQSGQLSTNASATAAGSLPGIAGGQGLTMNRRSTVSLMGSWGELRLGRDYVPHFWNYTRYDPFTTLGLGTSVAQVGHAASLNTTGVFAPLSNPAGIRASNSIGYLYNHPTLPTPAAAAAGVFGQAMIWFGENQSNVAAGGANPTKNNGDGYSLRVGYGAGPFEVAVGYGMTKLLTQTLGTVGEGNVKSTNLGASWDFGVAKLMGMWGRDAYSNTAGNNVTGWVFGATAPVGAGLIRAAVSQSTLSNTGAATDPRVRKYALGYIHNLSKRTAAYTTVARIRNSGASAIGVNIATTAAGSSSSGIEVGLRHSF